MALQDPRVGVGVLIRRGDQILLVRRKAAHGSGSWSTPGGQLDRGESPEACARREAMEEVGLQIDNVKFRALTNDIFEAEGRHYVTIWMEADCLRGDATVHADYEISAVAWFAWDALPDELFQPFSNLLAGRCYPAERGGLIALRVGPG